ncbi:MAG: hypothetical protein KBD31_04175 [Proteobacteria bacterium]|nr:hypothetical protein [Pseudomonadota bacterium]
MSLENLQNDVLKNSSLTSILIVYSEDDAPFVFKTYLWQDLDEAPYFLKFRTFLTYWERDQQKRILSFNKL